MNINPSNPLSVLTGEQVSRIHETTLSVLAQTGVKVLHDTGLKVLSDAGAQTDFDKKIAKFPSGMVEKYIKTAPKEFTIYARDETRNMEFREGIIQYVSMQTTPFVYDPDTGERRSSRFEDTCNMSRLADFLPHHADGYCMVYPEDRPEHSAHAYMLKAQIENSRKVFRGRVNSDLVAKDCLKIAAMVAGGEDRLKKRPMTYTLVSCTSPLVMDTAQIEGLFEYARLGQPCIMAAAGMSGATSPVTVAGTLVEINAEILSHIVLAQILRPGMPVIYGTAASVMDMKNSCLRYGAVEQGMLSAAAAQMARFYNIPSRVVAGATDSKTLDMQAGVESTRNLMMVTMAGANYVSCAMGGMDLGMTTSYEKVILDHENIAGIRHMLNGIQVDEFTLSGQVIREVGPGGQFLTHDQTLKHFKQAHFIPEFADTRAFTNWREAKDDIRDKVRQTIKGIIHESRAPLIDNALQQELDDFIAHIDRRQ